LQETIAVQEDLRTGSEASSTARNQSDSSISELWQLTCRNGRFIILIVGGLLVLCLVYCAVTPNVYEAGARIALRDAPQSVIVPGRSERASGSFASGQIQLETLANVFRSDQLAWDVIGRLKLYAAPGYIGGFARKFQGFNPAEPGPAARAYLLDEFQKHLTVETIPRTLVLEIRFRSHDAALSAAVVNALIAANKEQDTNARVEATKEVTSWLNAQLAELKSRVDHDEERLSKFQRQHGMLHTPEMTASGQPADVEHTAEMGEIDALGRELATATTDRILLEAEYRAASSGDPELVLASDQKLAMNGNMGSALLQQLRARRSDLEQEQVQLSIEHGPNFPRVVEIRNQMRDLDQQIKIEDTKLVDRFRSAWKAAADREELVRRNLKDATRAGREISEASLKYAVMRQEASASHEVYVRVMQQAEEASLAAGSESSDLSIIDYARQPVKPVSPNPQVYLAITFFISIWLAWGGARLRESIRSRAASAAFFIVLGLFAGMGSAQAPTPSTSGLPTGVARIPQSTETRSHPNAKDAPSVWPAGEAANWAGVPPGAMSSSAQPMPAPIGPGDLVQVAEAHTPDLRASVRVSEAGTVTLALAGDVHIAGLDERAAAHAIEAALIDRGMLNHPLVTVLVTGYAGQDVSVLGEVARPGIYSYTVHHCLLDLISAASGLTPNAGRLVTVTHRADPRAVDAVVLDPAGTDGTSSHNPELLPGDTVQVSRAGLVYVVGDVVRPGGFPVDPVQTTTAVQALSLAWGPGQNASLSKAVLIRERPGGRTLTTLNLKRMLRGQDPDIPIHDRDILFVPDSMAKNLWNRTMESVIQSAAGVSIYAGMVYSQRF
jgi:polysaccharide export outer membrane protein